jgi:CubicO group peptidase (beta-lactamase class C family)
LLAHRGGTNVPGFPGYPAGARLPSLLEILDGAPPANTPRVRVEHPPGAQYLYSGGGTTVLQQVVADVTGKPFAEVATELVLRPAGMAGAYLVPPGPSAKAHDEQGRALPGGYHRYPELAAAGLWCTAGDLAKLIRAFGTSWRGNGPLCSPATARLMATAVARGPTGLGVFVEAREDVPLLSHYGVNAGFRSVIAFAADASFGVVIMTDGEGGRWLIPELGQALFDARKLGRFPRLA